MVSWRFRGILLLLCLSAAIPAFADVLILKSGRHYGGSVKHMGTHYEVRYFYKGKKRWITARFENEEVAEVVSAEESAKRCNRPGPILLRVGGALVVGLAIIAAMVFLVGWGNSPNWVAWVGIALPVVIGVGSYYGLRAFGSPVWLSQFNIPPSTFEGDWKGVPSSLSVPLSNICTFMFMSIVLAVILVVIGLFLFFGWLCLPKSDAPPAGHPPLGQLREHIYAMRQLMGYPGDPPR